MVSVCELGWNFTSRFGALAKILTLRAFFGLRQVGDKSAEKIDLDPVRFGSSLQHRYYYHLGSCRRRKMEPSSRLQAENDLLWCSSPSAQAARWSAQWWVRTRLTTRLTRPFAAKTFQVPSRQLSPSKDGADQQPRS